MKLLHIIASPRGEKSRTLKISNEFLNTLKSNNPELVVDDLDLGKTKLPEVLRDAVEGKYVMFGGPELDNETQSYWDKIIALSKQFIEYDAYLISSPMWNFTVPYTLKHYIDVIMQAGVLFTYTENGVEGLVRDKKMVCITSRGSDYSENSQLHQYDFQEPYLRAIFGMTGIYDISFINAQPMDLAPGLTQASMAKAKEEARALALEFATKVKG